MSYDENASEILRYMSRVLYDLDTKYPELAPKIKERINICLPAYIAALTETFVEEAARTKTETEIVNFNRWKNRKKQQ